MLVRRLDLQALRKTNPPCRLHNCCPPKLEILKTQLQTAKHQQMSGKVSWFQYSHCAFRFDAKEVVGKKTDIPPRVKGKVQRALRRGCKIASAVVRCIGPLHVPCTTSTSPLRQFIVVVLQITAGCHSPTTFSGGFSKRWTG